jgi:hypothetical protein
VVSIARLTISLLRCRMADCGVRVTGLQPDPPVLSAIVLRLKGDVGVVAMWCWAV